MKAHHSVTSSILVTSKLKYPEGKRGTLQEKICFAYMKEYNTTVYMQQPKARERSVQLHLGRVVPKVDNTNHWINHYPMDSNLSGG